MGGILPALRCHLSRNATKRWRFAGIESFMELYIIAGPNGAGKTTFAREFLPKYANCTNFVNADLIAQGLAPFSPETAALRAGRTMLGEIWSFAQSGVSFAFETTLSGRSYLPLLRRLKTQGYEIHFFFLWLKSVDLALSRVRGARLKRRARRAGSNCPPKIRPIHSQLSAPLHAKRQSRCGSPHVVCRCDILSLDPDPECFPGLAIRRSRERVVLSVCSVLGLGDIGQQLDKPDRRLLQGATRAQSILSLLHVPQTAH